MYICVVLCIFVLFYVFFVLFYVFFVLFYVFFVLFYVYLCCSMYCLFCAVLCIVGVYMCTVLLPPGGYPIAVKYTISSQSHPCGICGRQNDTGTVFFLL